MGRVKKLVIKCIQFLYRNTASKRDLGFELGDTLDPLFGYMSGTPVDRFLIKKAFESDGYFKSLNQSDIQGIEVGDIEYLSMYFNNVQKSKIVFLEDQPLKFRSEHEVEGDLTVLNCEVSDYFDVAIFTQVFVFVKDDLRAIKNIKQMMKPNGLLIGSESLVAPLSIYDDSRWGENRRYSPRSLRSLLESEFEIMEFKVLGNAVSSAALVLGVPVESLDETLLSKSRHSHGTCMFYIAKKVG
jgi:SAM-dependent methyltransferase